MKKHFLFVATLAMTLGLASCNQEEIDRLNAQKDSIQTAKDQLEKQYKEEQDLMNSVMTNFTEIKQAQLGMAEEAQSKEGVNPARKEQIAENFKLLNDKFQENQAKIEELEQKLNQSNSRFASLQATIRNLKAQQAASKKEIESLQEQLSQKDIEIKSLNDKIAYKEQQQDSIKSIQMEREATIQAQDLAANKVYYLLANKKFLKERGLKDLTKADIKESLMTAVDRREFEANEGLDLKTKKAEILTSHPASSYTLAPKSKEDKTLVLKIKDYKSFWSTSNKLIIKIKD
ncbi:MAG: hypothetical protein MJZ24_02655 [Paludibacteraceae bacterium]|nr:hypothetical protein [Candidatus Physcocola equi]MCQ2233625.1 hypothetical protein [Paludibacteraceae bacterium]